MIVDLAQAWPWVIFAALLFFAAGWFIARRESRQLVDESRAMPQAYFKGLNFLLNEQQDEAIEALIAATKTNPESAELQFALGSLFRKRGEVDRAIRVHQHLAERGEFAAEQRITARLELALDYQRSGLLDHAEKILGELAAKAAGTATQQRLTLERLLNIHVQEKEWGKAVAMAERLATRAGAANGSYARDIAHYHCEHAEAAAAGGDSAAALGYLERALAANPACVRANVMKSEWLAKAGRHADSIAAWHQIEQQDPAYLGLLADQVLASYEAMGTLTQGLQDLSAVHQQYPALDMLNALFTATLKAEGPEAAHQLVKADLRENPTLVGLDRLLEALLLSPAGQNNPDLQVQKDVVHSHASRLAVYLCKQCGFKGKQFYWHCPACGGWETFPPRRTAEYETAGRHLVRSQIERNAKAKHE